MTRWVLALVAGVLASVGMPPATATAAPDPAGIPALPATLLDSLPGFERPQDRAVADLTGVYGAAAPSVVAGHVRTWDRTAGPVGQTVLAVATRLRDEALAREYARAFIDAARASGGTLLAVPGLPGVSRVSWAGAGERRFDAFVVQRGPVAVSISFTPAGLFDEPTLSALARDQAEHLRRVVPGADPVAPERVTESGESTRALGTVLPVAVLLAMVGAPIGVMVVRVRRAH